MTAYAYTLLTTQGELHGLDARELPAIEREWIEKAARAAKAMARVDRAAMRAELLNEITLQRKIETHDPVLHGDGEGLSLDEVTGPVPDAPDEDEVLRLAGVAGGWGSVSVLASEVLGVSRTWGEIAEDLERGPGSEREEKRRRPRRRRSR